jgi:membrane-bound ClpP family serine protease
MERLERSHGLALALVLIAAGGLLLFFQFFGGGIGHLWQLFIIVPGAALIYAASRTEWSASLAIAGAVVVGVGAILFVQDTFDYYRSWAYVWTLLPALAGAALMYVGDRRNDDSQRSKGRRLMQWSLGGLVVLAALFEFILFDGGTFWGRILVPVVLIGLGVFILLRRANGVAAADRTTQTPRSEGPAAPAASNKQE